MGPEPLLWLNGRIVEEADARISPFDRGFLWGDGAYEIRPASGPGRSGWTATSNDCTGRCATCGSTRASREPTWSARPSTCSRRTPRACARTACTGSVFVTRGADAPTMLARDAGSATVYAFLRPVDLSRFGAALREGGVRLALVPTRRTAAPVMEPRAKVTSRMNAILAELDADASGSLSLMQDADGFLTENSVANVFLVLGGRVHTPPGAQGARGHHARDRPGAGRRARDRDDGARPVCLRPRPGGGGLPVVQRVRRDADARGGPVPADGSSPGSGHRVA